MADLPDRALETLDEILVETRAGRETAHKTLTEIDGLRRDFQHHAASDAQSFGELKDSAKDHGGRLRTLELWQAGTVGAKAGAAPWLDSLLKVLLPLIALGVAAYVGLK